MKQLKRNSVIKLNFNITEASNKYLYRAISIKMHILIKAHAHYLLALIISRMLKLTLIGDLARFYSSKKILEQVSSTFKQWKSLHKFTDEGSTEVRLSMTP